MVRICFSGVMQNFDRKKWAATKRQSAFFCYSIPLTSSRRFLACKKREILFLATYVQVDYVKQKMHLFLPVASLVVTNQPKFGMRY